MSAVHYLRKFVNERLTAAAEEIFRVFETTIVEYEEEINRQNRLLDIVLKPEVQLQRIELPQQHVCKEEEEEEEEEEVLADQQVLADQHLFIQERSSSLDQEDPEPPQINRDQEEHFSSEEGKQLVLKQETDTFTLTSICEENDHSEDQTLDWSAAKPLSYNPIITSLSHETVNQDQKGGKHVDSGSARNKESQQQNPISNSDSNVDCLTMSMIHCNTHTGRRLFKCDTCEKTYRSKSQLQRHLVSHTDERNHSCKTCGKKFRYRDNLKEHVRIHTGEKLYTCKTCGKAFGRSFHLTRHMRIHTGEKPYTCKACGKDFRCSSNLRNHMKHTHTKKLVS